MKTISLIGIAAALCVPALASAQRGGGAVAVQRVEVQRADVRRLDIDRTRFDARDIDIRRGEALRGETGTRLGRRDHDPDRANHQARRRWNAANPPDQPDHHARRRWNAANPPADQPRTPGS